MALWREWAENRNLQPETASEPGFPIPTEIDKFQSFAEMDFWLQRFICEIRRKNGQPYPPSTLQNIAASIQRYLRTEKSMQVNFFKSDDQTFAEFRKTLDSHMRQLTNEGIGLEIKSADAVTAEDESKLWESGVFSFSTAKGLSNAVFFYNGKVFGLRGGDEQIGLLAEQFMLGYDTANKHRFVKFTPRIRKNAQGGLKQSKKTTGIMQPIVHYDTEVSGEYSIYRLYETYLNLIPRTGSFYRKPLDGLKFSAGNIPQKDLKSMMKTLFAQADIAIGSRNISNHSGRVTLCSTLYNKRFADKTVMNRSKHVSTAVHRYQREQFNLQADVSSELEPKIPEHFKSEMPTTKADVENKPIEPKTEKTMDFEKTENSCAEKVKSVSSIETNTLSMQIPSGVKKVVLQTHCGKKIVIEI